MNILSLLLAAFICGKSQPTKINLEKYTYPLIFFKKDEAFSRSYASGFLIKKSNKLFLITARHNLFEKDLKTWREKESCWIFNTATNKPAVIINVNKKSPYFKMIMANGYIVDLVIIPIITKALLNYIDINYRDVKEIPNGTNLAIVGIVEKDNTRIAQAFNTSLQSDCEHSSDYSNIGISLTKDMAVKGCSGAPVYSLKDSSNPIFAGMYIGYHEKQGKFVKASVILKNLP